MTEHRLNKAESAGLSVESPWLDVRGAAARAKCGHRSIYNGVTSGKLRAARLGGRRELRFLREWIDTWLIETSTPVMVNAACFRSEPSAVQS